MFANQQSFCVLPIEQILADLEQQLSLGDSIVVAPPGAGKSTYLPLFLLRTGLFRKQKIIMLQPRRIAVRSIAEYLSQQLNEPVGQTIGYRIKGEVKVSANTRMEIVTEGILTRMLQSEPELPEVGLVIFDEFHERNIHADFSLALCLEVQQALREDLRLLVMSATLDSVSLSTLMPQAKVLQSQGKSYPVEVQYHPDNSDAPLYLKVSRLVQRVFTQHQGDCLVFLPGAADINKVANQLNHGLAQNESVVICKLYGSLSKTEQHAALQRSAQGKRKIVLATNIAETSLTIQGIDCVVDSGIEKRGVFHLSSGITQLITQKISQASATQRAGRAGRLGPGSCYRLWSKEQQQRLMAQAPAQILQSDISSFMLESAIWGTAIADLALLDQPSPAQLNQAVDSLQQLQFFDSQQKPTALAKQAHQLGGEPRLANLLVKSAQISPAHQNLACVLVALLEDNMQVDVTQGCRLTDKVSYVLQHKPQPIWRRVQLWQKKLGCKSHAWPVEESARLLALAFPDWIAKHTNNGRYLLANGSGAQLPADDLLIDEPYLVVANMFSSDQQQGSHRISLAEPIQLDTLKAHFSHLIKQHHQVEWDESRQAISAKELQHLGAITLESRPLPAPPATQVQNLWQQVVAEKGIMRLPFSDGAMQYIYRCRLAQKYQPQLPWPDMSEQGLLDTIQQWLLPYLGEIVSWQQLQKVDFLQLVKNSLDWSCQSQLTELLPTHYTVPSGNKIKLEYTADGKVVLAVRMQEMYGLKQSPCIANNSLAVELQLLSPAARVLQTTQDLAGFWQGSYKEVQKEMKGRYQKHFWPDDPANAVATAKTKKRM